MYEHMEYVHGAHPLATEGTILESLVHKGSHCSKLWTISTNQFAGAVVRGLNIYRPKWS